MTDENSSDATPESTPQFPGAAAAIAAFGGIRPMAARLDVPVSTVQGWKQRDAIPENRVAQIRAAAAADGIDLSAAAAAGDDDSDGDVPSVAPPVASSGAPSGAPSGASSSQSASAARTSPDSAAEARPQPTQTAAAPAAQAASSGGTSALAVLALLVALAAGGGAGWLWWMQYQAQGVDLAGRIDALESEVSKRDAGSNTVTPAQLSALAGRVDTLAGKLETLSTAASANDLAGIRSELDDLRAATTGNSAAQSALQTGVDATMSDLSERLLAVEKRQGDTAAIEARAVGLAIAASEIRRTMRSGAPFASELATLRALAGADGALTQPLTTLAASAPSGLPTATDMARRFDALIGNILTADRVQSESLWYQQVLDRVSGLVSVRRIGGDSAGDSVDAIVARTEADLADGDLAGAVTEAATLQGPAGDVVAPWLVDARALLAAEDAVAAINTRALAALANLRGN